MAPPEGEESYVGHPDLPANNNTALDRNIECSLTSIDDSPLRRLSHVEYNRTLQDLFPEADLRWQDLPPDERIHGFENNARALNPSPVLVEERNAAAMQIAQRVVSRRSARSAVLGCDPTGNESACAREFIQGFGKRAFRRPLTADEVAMLHDFFLASMEAIDFDAALELTLQAFLQSPQFLYRIELGVAGAGDQGVAPLSDFELASRLSYTLWQTMPDQALLEAAAAGQLSDPAGYEAQVERMLASERAAVAFGDFHRQWAESDEVLDQQKDSGQFAVWNNDLKAAMYEESWRFPQLLYASGEASLQQLLTSRRTAVNSVLADFYGVEAPEQGWHAVELPADMRSGLLTRGAFLAGHARPTNGSPPLRGVAVMESLLCAAPPPPPPNIDISLPEQDPDMPMTNRQQFEAKTSVPPCSGCHQAIDGIGMSFEHYDAVGQWRSEDNGLPVDSSGQLLGTDVDTEYQDAIGLSETLAFSKQVEECMTVQWYRYAQGRDEHASDWCKIDTLQDALQAGDGNLRELLRALVTSYEFKHRIAIE